ncbi:hypothetical protein CWS72_23920 [Telmatospirillum siberiense]|uniref:Uncharacterized protein n=2 Tax=Telmatospirillum siberiense TaxID=382514 RepID=A0A2N3PNH5_9PROT|nr:hypothetical protein CWS72_23920 [Telmatospirillum siberiense]
MSRWRDHNADETCAIARRFGLSICRAFLPQGPAGDLQASFLTGVFNRASDAATMGGRTLAAVTQAWLEVQQGMAANPNVDARLTEAMSTADPRARMQADRTLSADMNSRPIPVPAPGAYGNLR